MNFVIVFIFSVTLVEFGTGRPAITRDVRVELPGSERINRRSLELPYSDEEYLNLRKRSLNPIDVEDTPRIGNRLHVRPIFREKSNSIGRLRRFAVVPTVYVPLHRSNDEKRRARRSNDNVEDVIGIPDDLKSDEVFQPIFRRNTRNAYLLENILGNKIDFQEQRS